MILTNRNIIHVTIDSGMLEALNSYNGKMLSQTPFVLSKNARMTRTVVLGDELYAVMEVLQVKAPIFCTWSMRAVRQKIGV